MDCQFAFLCDYGQESGGKLHALGVGWDTIYAGTLPARHPMMCFIARLSGTIVEAGTKELGIRIIDADGLDIVPPISQAIPFEVKPPQLSGNINVVINLGGLLLPKYGPYALHLTVQGQDIKTVPFRVSEGPTTG